MVQIVAMQAGALIDREISFESRLVGAFCEHLTLSNVHKRSQLAEGQQLKTAVLNSKNPYAPVAQWIEQWFPKPCVACSIHARGTIANKFKSACSDTTRTADLSRLTADLTATGPSSRPRIGNDLPAWSHRMNRNWPEST